MLSFLENHPAAQAARDFGRLPWLSKLGWGLEGVGTAFSAVASYNDYRDQGDSVGKAVAKSAIVTTSSLVGSQVGEAAGALLGVRPCLVTYSGRSAETMLPGLIVLTVLSGIGWLAFPLSSGSGGGRRAAGAPSAGYPRGLVVMLAGGSIFILGAWGVYASGFATGTVATVVRGASVVVVLVGLLLALIYFFWFQFRYGVAFAPRRQAEPFPRRQQVAYSAAGSGQPPRGGRGPFSSEEVELLPGETLYARLAVNGVQHGRAFGGRLHVTSRRLVFVPVTASAARGGSRWEVPLEQVSAADVGRRGRYLVDASWRRRLRVTTQSGDVKYFVAWRTRKAAKLIERARTFPP